MSLYQHLPGFETTLVDGGLRIKEAPEPALTDSVLIIGTASDGPVNEPYTVSRMENATALFGKPVGPGGVPNGTSLVRGMREAYRAGARDIRLLRYGGTSATGYLESPADTVSLLIDNLESIGNASGNAEVEIALGMTADQTPIATTIRVSASGSLLSSNTWTYEGTGKTVTIEADSVSSGATVRVDFDYQEESDVAIANQTLISSSTTLFVSPHAPWLASPVPVVKKNGTALEVTTDYTLQLAAGTVTLVVAAIESDVITASYTYTRTVTEPGTVTAVADGVTTPYSLDNTPISGTFNLWASGRLVSTSAYTVVPGDGSDPQVYLYSGHVTLGMSLVAQYQSVNDGVTVTPSINIRARYPGAVYNEVKLKVETSGLSKILTITKPLAKKLNSGEVALTYSSADYITFADLVTAVNSDTSNNVVYLSTEYSTTLTSSLDDIAEFYLGSQDNADVGDNGTSLSKNDIYTLLKGEGDVQGVFQLLENYHANIIVLMDVWADDPANTGDFGHILADYCTVMTARNMPCFGVIGCKPITSTTLSAISAAVTAWTARENMYYKLDNSGSILQDSNGDPLSIGQNLHVIAGPELKFQDVDLGIYSASMIAAFAGMLSGMPPRQSPMNKVVPGTMGLRYPMSLSQINSMIGARYVVARSENRLGVVIADSMTAASPTSDYSRTTTLRIAHLAVEVVGDSLAPYIGQPAGRGERESMHTAVKASLLRMKSEGDITDYGYDILFDPLMLARGHIFVTLSIVPVFEIRKINLVVHLRAS